MLGCLVYVQSFIQVIIDPESSTARRYLCVTIEGAV
jgi:hypothetical protein